MSARPRGTGSSCIKSCARTSLRQPARPARPGASAQPVTGRHGGPRCLPGGTSPTAPAGPRRHSSRHVGFGDDGRCESPTWAWPSWSTRTFGETPRRQQRPRSVCLARAGARPRGWPRATCTRCACASSRRSPGNCRSWVTRRCDAVQPGSRLMPVSADLGPLAAVLERAGSPSQTAARRRPSSAERWSSPERLPRPRAIALLSSGLFSRRLPPTPPRPPGASPTAAANGTAEAPVGPAAVAPTTTGRGCRCSRPSTGRVPTTTGAEPSGNARRPRRSAWSRRPAPSR